MPETETKLKVGHTETVEPAKAEEAIATAKAALPKGAALSVVHKGHAVTLTVVKA